MALKNPDLADATFEALVDYVLRKKKVKPNTRQESMFKYCLGQVAACEVDEIDKVRISANVSGEHLICYCYDLNSREEDYRRAIKATQQLSGGLGMETFMEKGELKGKKFGWYITEMQDNSKQT